MDLSDVVWIGGSPCAGKTTVAARLAASHDLTVYATDALEAEPASDDQPVKRGLQSLTPDEYWLQPVASLVASEIDCCREELALAVARVQAMPDSPRILVEGTALLPYGVVPHLSGSRRAVWLVPTPEFQRERYPLRGDWPHEVVAATSDPARAFENWMERDVRYARIVATIARELDQPVIEVDGRRSIDDITAEVAQQLSLV